MDPLKLIYLANPSKLKKKSTNGNTNVEAFNEVTRLLSKISNKDLQGYLCKIILEQYCCKEITIQQLRTIIIAIKRA